MFKQIYLFLSVAICGGLVFSAGAKEIKNLHYHTEAEQAAGDDYLRSQCRLDLRFPDEKKGWPVVIWFHGGGLTGGGRHYPALPAEIAVVAVGYRLSPKVELPLFIEDAASAVAWAFKNIANYGGDPEKIFISGHSAGGYLAAMVGMDPRWLAKHEIDHKKLAGIIPVSGQMTTHFHVKQLLGDTGHQFRPLIDQYAPLYYCAPGLPPICLITGGRDIEWQCRVEENQLLAISLKQVGCKVVEFHEMGGLDHGSVGQGAMLVIPGFIIRAGSVNWN
ncbi:MAG: alpha/beta hydrolase [Kiritimatiellae bacterium]|nr:alpha/beta hydrolase [Kiritimatiellia bacterium]